MALRYSSLPGIRQYAVYCIGTLAVVRYSTVLLLYQVWHSLCTMLGRYPGVCVRYAAEYSSVLYPAWYLAVESDIQPDNRQFYPVSAWIPDLRKYQYIRPDILLAGYPSLHDQNLPCGSPRHIISLFINSHLINWPLANHWSHDNADQSESTNCIVWGRNYILIQLQRRNYKIFSYKSITICAINSLILQRQARTQIDISI